MVSTLLILLVHYQFTHKLFCHQTSEFFLKPKRFYLKLLTYHEGMAGLSLSASFQRNSPGESEAIAGWILAHNRPVWKGKWMILRWIIRIIWYWTYRRTEKNSIKWFPTTSHFRSSMISNAIQIVSSACFPFSHSVPPLAKILFSRGLVAPKSRHC